MFFELSDHLSMKMYRPVVVNDVNGFGFGIDPGYLPIELDQLVGRDRLSLSKMHAPVYCVETSCSAMLRNAILCNKMLYIAMFFVRSMGKMRSGVKAFSFRLVVFCQGRLATVAAPQQPGKHPALRLFANLIQQAPKTSVGLKVKPGSALLTKRLQGPTRLSDERPRVTSDDRKELFFGVFCRVMFSAESCSGKRRAFARVLPW